MRKVSFFCAVLCFFFSSGTVVATEWSIEPSISLREEYSDNIRFIAAPHPGVWKSRLSPGFSLSSKTDVSEVSGSAQLNINRYAGDPQVEDRTDRLFSLLTRLQSERNTWVMMASYKQDSTTESEAITTGVVQTRAQRTARSLSPSWTRTLTERASFKLDYGYQDIKYDTHINLNDYTSQQVGGTLQYRLTERDQMGLAVIYSTSEYAPMTGTPIQIGVTLSGAPIYRSNTIVNSTDLRNVQLSLDHDFSETLSGSVTLGKRNSLSIKEENQALCQVSACTTPVTTKSEMQGTGTLFSAKLEKKFDASKVSGFASRDINASGGGLVETDRSGASLSRSLTENLTASFDANAYRTKYIDTTAPGSRYYTVEPRLNWRFTERWALDGSYRYAQYEPDSATTTTKSNAVYLNLTYNWPKMAVSR